MKTVANIKIKDKFNLKVSKFIKLNYKYENTQSFDYEIYISLIRIFIQYYLISAHEDCINSKVKPKIKDIS